MSTTYDFIIVDDICGRHNEGKVELKRVLNEIGKEGHRVVSVAHCPVVPERRGEYIIVVETNEAQKRSVTGITKAPARH